MVKEELIKVELTEFDAKLFLTFQQRYVFMKLLESLGVFELKNGRVIIHFDNLGQISSIDVNKHYKT